MTSKQVPRLTANPSPVRRPGSIRRTTSIDVTWDDGLGGVRRFDGHARDILLAKDGQTNHLRAEAQMQGAFTFDRTITAISADPPPVGLEALVGARGGGHLRKELRERLPELIADASPLYLLLDDLSGTSLVSNWGWSQWDGKWHDKLEDVMPPEALAKFQDRTGVCWGFRPGSSALETAADLSSVSAADALELRNPTDPSGWHDFPIHSGMSFRRARRIDVWRDPGVGGRIGIEASFQDSAARRKGGRGALHEYILRATLDPETLVIDSLEPEPRVLPFWECPGAITNAKRLIGTQLPNIRESVLAELRGPEGCTHLNDALRALAEVPALLDYLDKELNVSD